MLAKSKTFRSCAENRSLMRYAGCKTSLKPPKKNKTSIIKKLLDDSPTGTDSNWLKKRDQWIYLIEPSRSGIRVFLIQPKKSIGLPTILSFNQVMFIALNSSTQKYWRGMKTMLKNMVTSYGWWHWEMIPKQKCLNSESMEISLLRSEIPDWLIHNKEISK